MWRDGARGRLAHGGRTPSVRTERPLTEGPACVPCRCTLSFVEGREADALGVGDGLRGPCPHPSLECGRDITEVTACAARHPQPGRPRQDYRARAGPRCFEKTKDSNPSPSSGEDFEVSSDLVFPLGAPPGRSAAELVITRQSG